MDIAGKNILVTGAAGLVGSHIIDMLVRERPAKIVALDRNIEGMAANHLPNVDYSTVFPVKADISDAPAVHRIMAGIDIVIHTASLLTREAATDMRKTFNVNVAGTFNLIEASIASGVQKFIYSSSVSIYGESAFTPITEDHPFNATSSYGVGKMASEALLRMAHTVHGLEYVALRYAVVYGARQHDRANLVLFVPECFGRIKQGLPTVIYGDGSQSYDYVYVTDIARANLCAIRSSAHCGAYNIGTGVVTPVADVVQAIIDLTGTALPPERVEQGGRFRLSDQVIDVAKAEQDLAFKTQIPLAKGLELYYEWLKAHDTPH